MKDKKYWIGVGCGSILLVAFILLGVLNLEKHNFWHDLDTEETKQAVSFLAFFLLLGIGFLCTCFYLISREKYQFLYRENRKMNAIIDSSSNLIFYFCLHSKECDWYGDAEKKFKSHDKSLKIEEIVHPDDLPIMLQQFEDTRRGRTYSVETRMMDCNGKYHCCSCRMLPERDAAGKVEYICGIIQMTVA